MPKQVQANMPDISIVVMEIQRALEKFLAALDNARHAIAFLAGIGTLLTLESGEICRGFYAGGFKVLDDFKKYNFINSQV